MRRRFPVAIAVWLAGSPAVAQETTPPAVGAPVPAAAEPAAPAPAAAAPRALQGWELDIAIWGGPYSGGANEKAAGGFDAGLLLRSHLLAGGFRAGSEWMAGAFVSSVGLTGGVLLPLSASTRLDLLADAGLGLHMIPKTGGMCEGGAYCDERDGANKVRPSAGARAGFSFLTGDGRLAFSLGAFAKLVPEQQVDLQRRTCLFTSCSTSTETRTIGGKVFGAYLALGFPRRF